MGPGKGKVHAGAADPAIPKVREAMLLLSIRQGRGEQGRSEKAKEGETGTCDGGVSPARSGLGWCGRELLSRTKTSMEAGER